MQAVLDQLSLRVGKTLGPLCLIYGGKARIPHYTMQRCGIGPSDLIEVASVRLHLTCTFSYGGAMTVFADPRWSTADLKEHLHVQCGERMEEARIMFGSRELQDGERLDRQGLTDNSAISVQLP